MSTPLLWIAVPAALAILAFFFRRWKRTVATLFSAVALFLSAAAWFLPFNEQIIVGPWAFVIDDRINILGRQFVLGVDDRVMLISIYLVAAFFLIGSISARVSKLFAPITLAISAIFVASFSVEPYLYAALFIQAAVLVGVPLISPPGRTVDRGVLLYLIFLSFGFPFILFSGWMLTGIDVDISNPNDVLPALVFLGFGFAFLLAVFPLNTWIPMLMEKVHPYPVTFFVTIFPLIVISLLQRFTQNFQWIFEFEIIQMMGLFVVLTAGLWAAFQRNLGRLLGYAAIIEIGRSLLVVSQSANLGVTITFLLPRLIAFGIWALCLSLIQTQNGELGFRETQGLARKAPLLAWGILVGVFSVAGFPLLAGFPIQYLLFTQLSQSSTTSAFLGLAGSVGLLIGGLRTFAVFIMGPEDGQESLPIDQLSGVLIVLSIIILAMMGIFPQIYINLFPST